VRAAIAEAAVAFRPSAIQRFEKRLYGGEKSVRALDVRQVACSFDDVKPGIRQRLVQLPRVQRRNDHVEAAMHDEHGEVEADLE
jgi:hypothetical protein